MEEAARVAKQKAEEVEKREERIAAQLAAVEEAAETAHRQTRGLMTDVDSKMDKQVRACKPVRQNFHEKQK